MSETLRRIYLLPRTLLSEAERIEYKRAISRAKSNRHRERNKDNSAYLEARRASVRKAYRHNRERILAALKLKRQPKRKAS